MRDHGANVTHLTPAMGQILVGGATTQFWDLHHAFFVGDVLTKRDCNLLRTLAPNVNIINSKHSFLGPPKLAKVYITVYGTTETQRAVSYFEIPSKQQNEHFLDDMKEIIPAGRGMLDVQLLVVDQNDRTKQCDVGETGEIYVRAGGLAEGYLGDKVLNEKKFVVNWFIDPASWMDRYKQKHTISYGESGCANDWRNYYKGPRDRLYRTGDLGRYLPSGDVECTGKEKST